jgi:H+/Cl- antiporter ClcA
VNAARRLGLWLGRLALLVGMIVFAAAVALFSAVTYLELTEGEAQSPISILTALLVPVCGALAAACWWLFAETFKRSSGEPGRSPAAARRR